MKVRVLFFGATADAVGEREIDFDLTESTNASRALREIIDRFPQLEKHSLLFAVNQEYANDDDAIKSGDELAVFTAVSGG